MKVFDAEPLQKVATVVSPRRSSAAAPCGKARRSCLSPRGSVMRLAPEACTVTDVGSTKGWAARLPERFLGGHPVCGREARGPGHATADLFDGATWFLTPVAGTDPERYRLDYRPEVLLTYHSNPVWNMPAQGKVRQAIESFDYVISIDVAVNETTEYADLILPDHTYLESTVAFMCEPPAVRGLVLRQADQSAKPPPGFGNLATPTCTFASATDTGGGRSKPRLTLSW